MFIARTLFHPVPGRGPKLRSVLEGLPQSGQWLAVGMRLSGPVLFTVNRRYDDLRAFQEGLGRTPNPLAGKLDGLLAQTPERELWETTLDVPAGPVPGFTSRFTYEAAAGKGGELRRIVEDWIQKRNSAGGRAGVSVLVAGGPQSLSVTAAHADLAALQATRARALADPATQAYAQQLASVLARPPATPELFQIIASSQ